MKGVADTPANSRRQGKTSWWWTAIRLRTLSMAAVPVSVGSTLAWAEGAPIAWATFLATLLCALSIQVGTNLFNDVGDAVRGNDGPDRIGPQRVTAAGLASPQQVKHAAIYSFAVALLLGGYLVSVGGWAILALGLASLFAGWAYSSGPRPLSYTPWGEVAVVVFFGIAAVAGSHYLQSGGFTASAVLTGLVLGAPAAAVLLVNNVRDFDADRRVGRFTLAVLLGPLKARWLYLLLMCIPFLLLPLMGHPAVVWTAMPALLLFLWLSWRFLRREGAEWLNGQLAHTAQAQLLLGLLLCIGLLW